MGASPYGRNESHLQTVGSHLAEGKSRSRLEYEVVTSLGPRSNDRIGNIFRFRRVCQQTLISAQPRSTLLACLGGLPVVH
jgi:hypothetical protein